MTAYGTSQETVGHPNATSSKLMARLLSGEAPAIIMAEALAAAEAETPESLAHDLLMIIIALCEMHDATTLKQARNRLLELSGRSTYERPALFVVIGTALATSLRMLGNHTGANTYDASLPQPAPHTLADLLNLMKRMAPEELAITSN